MKSDELDKEISYLQQMVSAWRQLSARPWKDVWDQIKYIGSEFKETRYPTSEDKDRAWKRFQDIVESAKERQGWDRDYFTSRSSTHKSCILQYARRAKPFAISTVADIPILSSRRRDLESMSSELKEAYKLFSKCKHEMTGRDKKEVFEELGEIGHVLQLAWDDWKEKMDQAHQEKRDAWLSRQQANADNLREKLSRAYDALEKRESHLRDLIYKRDTARSDEYRNRVIDWIPDEERRIEDIRSSISRMEGWLEETLSKLR